MRKTARRLPLLACLLGALLVGPLAQDEAHAQPSPAAYAALTPAHVKALRDILLAWDVAEGMMESVRTEKVPPESEELSRGFYATLSQEKVTLLVLPLYARFIDEREALAIAATFNGSGMRKVLAYQRSSRRGQSPLPPLLTQAEHAEVGRAAALPAMKHYQAQKKTIQEASSNAWGGLVRAYVADVDKRAMKALFNGMTAAQAAAGKPGSQTIKLDSVGIGFYDKMIKVFVDAAIKVGFAETEFDKSVEASHFDEVLLPKSLKAPQGISRGRAIIDETEAHLERYLRVVDSAQKDCEEGLAALIMPNKASIIANAERSMAANYAYMLKFGEAQRRILELNRNFISFAESRQGHWNIENDKFMFETDEDLKLANLLAADLKEALANARAMSSEREQLRRDRLKTMSGG